MDDWNDWWEYRTLFQLYYVDDSGEAYTLGALKIGQFGMLSDRPELPQEFERVPENTFSLGQDETYYENIRDLGPELRQDILRSLGDIALNAELRRRALGERVTEVSILRDVTLTTIRGQFHRIAKGGARLTPYEFTFRRTRTTRRGPIELSFKVSPESKPPTNIHVLIGRNGAGKSTILNDIGVTFTKSNARPGVNIANVVTVSFSAFDEFVPIIASDVGESQDIKGRTFHYIGLKKVKMIRGIPLSSRIYKT